MMWAAQGGVLSPWLNTSRCLQEFPAVTVQISPRMTCAWLKMNRKECKEHLQKVLPPSRSGQTGKN